MARVGTSKGRNKMTTGWPPQDKDDYDLFPLFTGRYKKGENKMEVGKIEFNTTSGSPNLTSGPLKGWPKPKTKEDLVLEEDGHNNFRIAKPANPSKYPSHRPDKEVSVLDRQVGGSHYKQYKIQPYEFFLVNQIPHHKAAIIRRILRYDHPTGKGLEDLQKIMHEIEMIIQLENWED